MFSDTEEAEKETAPAKTTSAKPVVTVEKEGKTAYQIVVEVIKKSGKEGISIKEIEKATEYETKRVNNVLFKAKKAGEVKAVGRGVVAFVKK